MQVKCLGCGSHYNHAFPERVVCPACGSPDYTKGLTDKTEETRPALEEQRGPRLLTEVQPQPGHILAE